MQAQTHDLGNLFVQRLHLKLNSSLYHRAPTNETEAPFRTALTHIIRVPGTTFGFALGRWRSTGRTEEDALLAAISGKWSALKFWNESTSDKARRFVSNNSRNEEERAMFNDMLGLNDEIPTTLPGTPQSEVWRPGAAQTRHVIQRGDS